MVFRKLNKEGMEFFIHWDELFLRISLLECLFEKSLKLVVGIPPDEEWYSSGYSPCVRINHKDWFVSGVQQNGIRSLRAYPIEPEKLLSYDKCIPVEK